ncbi:MAG: hypothetical protein JW955_03605 [Sedimentisphaerales bacterium]|nr:hypothetical protein [Sedimentisphaerales bacterium]
MTNARALLIIGFASVVVFASTALGAPMGPPMALLGQGHWGVGGEYGHGSMDLEGNGRFKMAYGADSPAGPVTWPFDERVSIDDLVSDMFFATVGYGICDHWDVFARLGAANASDEATGSGYIPLDPHLPDDFVDVPRRCYDLDSLDCNFGFAWGVGTRFTFFRWGPWSVGGLAQGTWFYPGKSDVEYTDPVWPEMGLTHVGDATIELWQVQASLAASYQVDTWRFWVGPFFQYVGGQYHREGDIVYDDGSQPDSFRASSDLELAKDASMVGAHFGANWGINKYIDLWAEGQVSFGDTWFVGVGLIIKPQGAPDM